MVVINLGKPRIKFVLNEIRTNVVSLTIGQFVEVIDLRKERRKLDLVKSLAGVELTPEYCF
jgi:hypothetical protein